MRIAIIIPAYNEEGNIGRLVEETIAAVPEKRRKATKIDNRVNVVRNLRRQTFFQISGRNFMPDRFR